MEADKWASFLAVLLEKTKRKRIEWKETNDESTLMVQISEYLLFVSCNEESSIYRVQLQNMFGKELERFVMAEGEYYYDTVAEIYTLAKRNVLKIDEALKEMQDELEKDSDLPF
jgi:hypothetical protein